MKIIGKTGDGFICEVSNREIEAILGKGDTRRNNVVNTIYVGTELTFASSIDRLSKLKELKGTTNYTNTRAHIHNLKLEVDKLVGLFDDLDKPMIVIGNDLANNSAV